MIRQTMIFTALFCCTHFLQGENAKLLDSGVLELDGWQGTLTTFDTNWRTLQPESSPRIYQIAERQKNADESRIRYRLELPNTATGTVSVSLKNGTDLQGTLELENGALIRYLCFQSSFRISLYRGAMFEADGKQYKFPADYQTETIFNKQVRRFRFPTKSGEILLEGDFYLRIQDGRKWNGASYGVRIGFLPYTGTIRNAALGFRIRHGKAGEFGQKLGSVEQAPYTAKAGAEWKAFEYHRNVLPGSALDFSAPLDAPAGKYGPVITGPNGQFVFRDRPEIPVRFYGANFVGDSQLPDKKTAEELADRFATLGFNVVRFHHHDNEIYDRSGREPSRILPERMDRLDYLIACLKKRGIYYTTDVYVSRRNIPSSELGGMETIKTPREYKALFYVDDRVYADWKRWAEAFLGHVNPYTGLALKDDPALITLSLVNEGNPESVWDASPRSTRLYQKQFKEWQKNNPNGKFAQFLSHVAVKRFGEMKNTLRELGCKTLLSDQNFVNRLALAADRKHYDFVDNHAYWDHPRFAEKPWSLPVLPNQYNAISTQSSVPGILFPTRLFGKGFTVSEFDYANPNIYRAAGPALTGAYAAFQNWDGLFPFAYSHSQASVINPKRTSGFFDIATDPVKAFSQRIGAKMFLTGGLKPGEKSFAAILTDPFRPAPDAKSPASFIDLGFLARIGSVTELPSPGTFTALVDLGAGTASGKKLPVFQASADLIPDLISAGHLPKACYDASAGRFASPDGQLELNRRNQTFRATAPRGEVLVTGTDGKLNGQFFNVEKCNGFAVFALLPVKPEKLADAHRLTLIHLTNTQASGMRFENRYLDRLESWGTLPFLAKHGTARINLRLPGSWKGYALDTAGKRIGELPVLSRTDGSKTLEIDNFRYPEAVFAYELIRQ